MKLLIFSLLFWMWFPLLWCNLKTETQLLNEIENVGRAYAQLDEQNSRKVFDLTQKEDHIAKLQAEVGICIIWC